MSSRKVRYYDSSTQTTTTAKFTFDKSKRYKWNKSSGAVEEITTVNTLADDEITIAGSKSALRRISDIERNVSILASKLGVAGKSNDDTESVQRDGDTMSGDLRIDKSDAAIILNDSKGSPEDQSIKIRAESLDANLPGGEGLGIFIEENSSNGSPDTTPALIVTGQIYAGSTNKVWHTGNDGSGSGLDADKLDGLDSTSFLRSDTNDTYTGLLQFGDTNTRIDGHDTFPLVQVNGSRAYFGSTSRNKTVIASADTLHHVRAGTEYTIWTAYNDGSGSGLDADTVDGLEASAFALASHSHSDYISKTSPSSAFIEIGAGDAQYDKDYVKITASNSYEGVAFAGGKYKYFAMEANVRGSGGANHQGFFWGSNTTSSVFNGNEGGYKTTHQNSTSFHIRDMHGNANQTTVNPGFDPNDGNWHHHRVTATPDGKVRVYIDGVKIIEGSYIPSNPGYVGFINYTGVAEFANFSITALIDDTVIANNVYASGELKATYNTNDGTTAVKGYGIEMSRVSSYLRPTTDGTQTLFIGGADATLDWNNVQIKTTSGVTVTGDFYATGDVCAYSTSDVSFKENITPISNPLDKIMSIRGVEFDWSEDYVNTRGGVDGYFTRKHDVGVIAQEVETVMPEVVGTRSDGTKGVRYEKMVGLLIEAIKDQQLQIQELKNIIEGK